MDEDWKRRGRGKMMHWTIATGLGFVFGILGTVTNGLLGWSLAMLVLMEIITIDMLLDNRSKSKPKEVK